VSEHLPERPAAPVLRRCHHIAYHGHAARRGRSKRREHGLEALSMYTATRSPRSRMQFLFDKGAQATESGKHFCVNFIVSHRNPEMLLQCVTPTTAIESNSGMLPSKEVELSNFSAREPT
jgi:hypothetical protein